MLQVRHHGRELHCFCAQGLGQFDNAFLILQVVFTDRCTQPDARPGRMLLEIVDPFEGFWNNRIVKRKK